MAFRSDLKRKRTPLFLLTPKKNRQTIYAINLLIKLKIKEDKQLVLLINSSPSSYIFFFSSPCVSQVANTNQLLFPTSPPSPPHSSSGTSCLVKIISFNQLQWPHHHIVFMIQNLQHKSFNLHRLVSLIVGSNTYIQLIIKYLENRKESGKT